jgi:hypothetical protein
MNVKKSLENRILGWLPKQPTESNVILSKPELRNLSMINPRKMRISFVMLGLILWGFASYLFNFTKTSFPVDNVSTGYILPIYWVESLFLFIAGIAIITFTITYKKTSTIKKRGVGVITLGTSLLSLGTFLTFGLPIELLSCFPDFVIGFFLSVFIMTGITIMGLGTLVVFHSFHYEPWNYIKPKKLKDSK